MPETDCSSKTTCYNAAACTRRQAHGLSPLCQIPRVQEPPFYDDKANRFASFALAATAARDVLAPGTYRVRSFCSVGSKPLFRVQICDALGKWSAPESF